ncbi:nicotinate-nucleotide adenylyltransferase [Cytobacillus horneckiae]|uniref:Probable nicotinate-nucleotide adenylyltransferase n=1 Tax=Cytobacillus horneckiae TaxID=549687 RepID=A0A2N0ZI97_9BACI|nr:nicotinate-nucleotide adenylyltransferase [Cytobacillus horneckiae]MBN6888946.1 nicotinate-nucleotide adenylyltransferase [Cytobacillus horneckiae]MCM3179873.1 nicotinate-nucleotide adenylyltransferase [Cytobacillus horneckiae]MEC1155262.1 nicotinate-nucleotide adenylyltransferase [Cytobacillus horneckiae]MED2936685.1 nicotinate-nucleotide adenylyltransferase [Cytobacillus horneckiae]PKG29242.1 nicotinate-nucleotide adenylyltransferase [Cytobacillus horneckiae]
MKKVGILGGTFDPPHIGHLIIANEVLHTQELDEIWFMPNQEPPHKVKTNKISNADRVNLLRRAISTHKQFRIETIELERKGPSYTAETMKILTEREKDVEFYFIIGADMVEYLPKWHQIDQLLHLVRFIGVKRPDYNLNSKYPIIYVDVPEIGISSSLIRQRVEEGKTIRYLVPDEVRVYMKENRLYES